MIEIFIKCLWMLFCMDGVKYDCCENSDGVTLGYANGCPYGFGDDGCAGDGAAKCAARVSNKGLMASVMASSDFDNA